MDIDWVFLLRAVNDNADISVQFEMKNKEPLIYNSRFFEINRHENYITIDCPVRENGADMNVVPLKPKDKITVLFKFSGFRFLFYSEVMEKTTYPLDPKHIRPALKIQVPAKLQDDNRRNYYRVSVPPNEAIELNYSLLGKGDNAVVSTEPLNPLRKSRSFQALMLDISEGGIAVKGGKNGAENRRPFTHLVQTGTR